MGDLIARLSGMVHTLFFKMLDLGFLALKPLLIQGRLVYHSAVREKLIQRNFVFNDYRIDDLGHRAENRIGEAHENFAVARRIELAKVAIGGSDELPIVNLLLFAQPADAPLLFVESYCLEEERGHSLQSKSTIRSKPSDTTVKTIDSKQNLTYTSKLIPSSSKETEHITISDIKPVLVPRPTFVLSDSEDNVQSFKISEQKGAEIKHELEEIAEGKEAQTSLTDQVVSTGTKEALLHNHLAVPKSSSIPLPAPSTLSGEVHLAIFVHGYEGCSFDMKLLKNTFCFLAKPHVVFHCSTANEGDSTGDIDEQGALLAAEIEELIKINFKPQELKKISFFGHSLGGLVVRAALPRLEAWKDRFHAYFSFATPHLGCSNGSSTLVKIGLKMFSSFMGHKCLNQMGLSDADLKDCFLMRLSNYKGLDWFEHVLVFGSFQDLYVPYESARIEYGEVEIKDKKRSHLYKRMVQNILGKLKGGRLIRVDLVLKQNGSLNSKIGRSAHIRILDSLELQMAVGYFFVEYLN